MICVFVYIVEFCFVELMLIVKCIVSYMFVNFDWFGFEIVDQIVQQIGISGILVGCFLCSVGYWNFDDLKCELCGGGDCLWMIIDWFDEYCCIVGMLLVECNGGNGSVGSVGMLVLLFECEFDVICYVYCLVEGLVFVQVVDWIVYVDVVFIFGIQLICGISNVFSSYFEYLCLCVFYFDGQLGLYVDLLNFEFEYLYCVVIDMCVYLCSVCCYCQVVVECGQLFVLVIDLLCLWVCEWLVDLLQVKIDVGQFWDLFVLFICLFNLLIMVVVDCFGFVIDWCVVCNCELQCMFDQFEF